MLISLPAHRALQEKLNSVGGEELHDFSLMPPPPQKKVFSSMYFILEF
jgi:hypothetical protein